MLAPGRRRRPCAAPEGIPTGSPAGPRGPGARGPIVHDVPLPNGLLAMRVAVTRLTDMPGWSMVETWTERGADCRRMTSTGRSGAPLGG